MSRIEAQLDPAYRLATVILLDHIAAEEAVHGAAMRAWRRYRSQRGAVINYRTWFLSMVVDQCRTVRWLRPLRLRRRTEAVQRAGGIGDAILRLNVGTRAALFCFFYLDLPMDEVAHVLRVPPARVRSRVHRANARLRAYQDAGDSRLG